MALGIFFFVIFPFAIFKWIGLFECSQVYNFLHGSRKPISQGQHQLSFGVFKRKVKAGEIAQQVVTLATPAWFWVQFLEWTENVFLTSVCHGQSQEYHYK